MSEKRSVEMGNSIEELNNVLEMVENTFAMYDEYSSNIKNNEMKESEIKGGICKCRNEYDDCIASNSKILIKNDINYSLSYEMKQIEDNIWNKLVKIEINPCNNAKNAIKSFELIGNINSSHNIVANYNYQICSFDPKYTKLSRNSNLLMDNKYIKIGNKNEHCYATVKNDINNANGYKSGQHCFRMYYKNPDRACNFLFFGIYPNGVVPSDGYSCEDKNAWGIAGYSRNYTYRSGKLTEDSNIKFLYELETNLIDMFVDFDKEEIIYKIVSNDNCNGKEYKLNGFVSNISYSVHIHLFCAATEVQVAKIDISMFGKDRKLVKWSKTY